MNASNTSVLCGVCETYRCHISKTISWAEELADKETSREAFFEAKTELGFCVDCCELDDEAAGARELEPPARRLGAMTNGGS